MLSLPSLEKWRQNHFCSGRFPKEGGMNGLSELRECH